MYASKSTFAFPAAFLLLSPFVFPMIGVLCRVKECNEVLCAAKLCLVNQRQVASSDLDVRSAGSHPVNAISEIRVCGNANARNRALLTNLNLASEIVLLRFVRYYHSSICISTAWLLHAPKFAQHDLVVYVNRHLRPSSSTRLGNHLKMKLSAFLHLPLALLSLFLIHPLPALAGTHTSNWAVLVSTSRFWFNYRHLANVLSLYRSVKRLGIPDSQIILMLPDDMACNPRNAFPGTVYNNADRGLDLYGDNIEVDYRGYEVTVENFIRLLTDRLGEDVPRGKRLGSDAGSNVLVYMTGHGGNEFLKFQDAEEIGGWDLADAFEQMWEKKRYNEMLFMIDTCQANTLFKHFYSPNIIAAGSSELDQSSYSHHADNDVGVAVIDRWTYYNLEFLEREVTDPGSKRTLGDLFDSYDESLIHSRPGIKWDLFPGGEDKGRERLVVDFFGNVQGVEVGNDTEWEEDLRRLEEIIRRAREREGSEVQEQVADLRTNITEQSYSKRNAERRQVESAAKVEKGSEWSQRLVGLGTLLGCAVVWSGVSWYDSKSK